MLTINDEMVIRKDDYKLLLSYVNGANPKSAFDRRNAVSLHTELKKAILVDKEDFPNDVVRINATVRVKTEETGDIMQITLVTPDKANIRDGMISVMAPIGTALIGRKKGQQVSGRVLSAKKTYRILDVNHPQ